ISMRHRYLIRPTCAVVLVCFLATLAAPILEARAPVVLVKVPGEQLVFDVNGANAALLQRLPGLGPKTAAEIVKYRAARRPFRSVDGVANVPGAGSARLKIIKAGAVQAARPDLRIKTNESKAVTKRTAAAPRKATATASRPIAKLMVSGPKGSVNLN